jgi:hypothetical protein
MGDSIRIGSGRGWLGMVFPVSSEYLSRYNNGTCNPVEVWNIRVRKNLIIRFKNRDIFFDNVRLGH